MATYAFRINCRIAPCDFQTAEREFTLNLPDTPPITVSLPTEDGVAGNLILRCGGFSSEEKARSVGQPVKVAVVLAGLLLGTGIDAGADEIMSPAPMLGGVRDERSQPDVHGLQVFPEVTGMQVFGFAYAGDVERITSPIEFLEKVEHGHKVASIITRRQQLAAQLYAQSHFHSSPAARFLTLISAVESLAERPRRSAAARTLIAEMIKFTKNGDLADDERKSLNAGLGNLGRESISATCKALVATHSLARPRSGSARAAKASLQSKGRAPASRRG